jgi:hypothetical protein
MEETERLQLVVEAVRYSQRVKALGMPVAGYAKTVREAVYFAWTRRLGAKCKSATYRSIAANGKRWGRREVVYDHVVPYRYELAALMELSKVTSDTVRAVLEKYDVAAIITREEDDRLTAAGLQSKMPDGWDGIDSLARYKAVGIEIAENLEYPNP